MAGAAPLFPQADGPQGGVAQWLTTSDGVRVRVAVWGRDAPKGTVLLFPGRTEYVEKYGRAAGDLLARGFATVAIDWRGQGLADRLQPVSYLEIGCRTGGSSKFSSPRTAASVSLSSPRPPPAK